MFGLKLLQLLWVIFSHLKLCLNTPEWYVIKSVFLHSPDKSEIVIAT